MSLSVYINYSNIPESDNNDEYWSANITHNLCKMARQIPVGSTSLYMVVWRPEEIFKSTTTNVMLIFLVKGINYMISHRKELLPFEPDNGWGTYDVFLKFLLDYKNACEDNPDCLIEVCR